MRLPKYLTAPQAVPNTVTAIVPRSAALTPSHSMSASLFAVEEQNQRGHGQYGIKYDLFDRLRWAINRNGRRSAGQHRSRSRGLGFGVFLKRFLVRQDLFGAADDLRQKRN